MASPSGLRRLAPAAALTLLLTALVTGCGGSDAPPVQTADVPREFTADTEECAEFSPDPQPFVMAVILGDRKTVRLGWMGSGTPDPCELTLAGTGNQLAASLAVSGNAATSNLLPRCAEFVFDEPLGAEVEIVPADAQPLDPACGDGTGLALNPDECPGLTAAADAPVSAGAATTGSTTTG
jgi:hypothetical protein